MILYQKGVPSYIKNPLSKFLFFSLLLLMCIPVSKGSLKVWREEAYRTNGGLKKEIRCVQPLILENLGCLIFVIPKFNQL